MRVVPLKIESKAEAKQILDHLGVSREGMRILAPKSISVAFKVGGISSWEANIIKQHLLSLGSDSAINRSALLKKVKTSTIIFGNVSQLRRLCNKLKHQPFNLKEVSGTISRYLDNLFQREFLFCARNKVVKIKSPLVCGIVNVTPDSFSGDGLLGKTQNSKLKIQNLALRKVGEMVKQGARIIDIGGESTRPFSKPVRDQEELRRVIPALKAVRKEFKDILISVDTYKYRVAKEAIEYGVDIINDITALRNAPQMASLIKKYKLGCILMHMRGRPKTMQIHPRYKDVMEDIIDFFGERIKFCQERGIQKAQILIDPGIGFGKSVEDNLKIIHELYKFKIFGMPIFLGLSRKSFVGKTLNVGVEKRLVGTIAASVVALIQGVQVLRVHDVGQTQEAIKIVSAIFHN
ncbi:MAG: dihydropteroate synthase [Candidatus Omnitrophota bacterium]|nr:MAG: dihydropteroate synthase [Candidatus Omnitrophota bacterium]